MIVSILSLILGAVLGLIGAITQFVWWLLSKSIWVLVWLLLASLVFMDWSAYL